MIRGILKGDPAAERAFFESHVDRIFRLAYRMTGDETMAEDFTQETFIRAYGAMDRFEGRSALSTWLHAIAVTVVINGLRKITRIRSREIDLELLGGAGGAARLGTFRDLDLKRWIHAAIDELPDDLRLVFVLHDIEGFRHREIAEILDVPAGTTKSRLSRARRRLREALGGLRPDEAERRGHERRETR